MWNDVPQKKLSRRHRGMDGAWGLAYILRDALEKGLEFSIWYLAMRSCKGRQM